MSSDWIGDNGLVFRKELGSLSQKGSIMKTSFKYLFW